MTLIKTNSIKASMIMVILLGVLLPITLLIVFAGIQYGTQAEEIAKSRAIGLAHRYSRDIEKTLNELFATANTFADIQTSTILENGLTSFQSTDLNLNQVEILKNNEQAIAFYTIYLPGHIIDTTTGLPNEKLALIGNTQYKNKISPLVFWDYKFKSNIPDTLRKGNGYMLIPPYKDVYENDSLFMITYGHAILSNNQIIGLVGADMSIDWIQKLVTTSTLFNNSADIKIISNRGIINAYNKDVTKVGMKISDQLADYEKESKLLFSNEANDIRLSGDYIFYEPIQFGKLKDTWHIRIAIPENQILGKSQKALILGIIVAVVLAMISMGITFYYFNNLTKRITQLASASKRIAKGSLYIDFETTGNDEITDLGNSLLSIVTRFSDIIKGLKSTLGQLDESSNALSQTAVKLSEGAAEQASSTQQVSASMEQMSANIEQNAENSKIADEIAHKSSKLIEESSKSVKSTANSMGEIAKKTTIIGDIAFQVNILALNAAVEAARAGVHGRGFAVVANEVGKLADRSKLAAAEIDELTNKSFAIAKKSGSSLEQIVPEIQKTASLVQDITNASMEQKSGTEQINNAIQQLNNVTQQNASSAEQLASNVEALTMLSDKLNKFVSFFKLEASQRSKKLEKSISKQNTAISVIKSGTDATANSQIEKQKLEKTDLPKSKAQLSEKNKEVLNKDQKLKSEKGYNFDLGKNDILDDGFEKF